MNRVGEMLELNVERISVIVGFWAKMIGGNVTPNYEYRYTRGEDRDNVVLKTRMT